jgi:hypothetical protein
MSKVAVVDTVPEGDGVGRQLVYHVKEGLRASRSMVLVPLDESEVQVRILTLDPEAGSQSANHMTVYAAVWTYYGSPKLTPYYYTSIVGECGSARVGQVADELVAKTDKAIHG